MGTRKSFPHTSSVNAPRWDEVGGRYGKPRSAAPHHSERVVDGGTRGAGPTKPHEPASHRPRLPKDLLGQRKIQGRHNIAAEPRASLQVLVNQRQSHVVRSCQRCRRFKVDRSKVTTAWLRPEILTAVIGHFAADKAGYAYLFERCYRMTFLHFFVGILQWTVYVIE